MVKNYSILIYFFEYALGFSYMDVFAGHISKLASYSEFLSYSQCWFFAFVHVHLVTLRNNIDVGLTKLDECGFEVFNAGCMGILYIEGRDNTRRKS